MVQWHMRGGSGDLYRRGTRAAVDWLTVTHANIVVLLRLCLLRL